MAGARGRHALRPVRALFNPHAPAPRCRAARRGAAFHRALPGYTPTPLHDLPGLAAERGSGRRAQGRVRPARAARLQGARRVVGGRAALRERRRSTRSSPPARATTDARSRTWRRGAGCAAGSSCPARAAGRPPRGDRRRGRRGGRGRRQLRGGGRARRARRARSPAPLEIADVGDSGPARWVIDGYATLFAELAPGGLDVLLVPVGRRLARCRRGAVRRAGRHPSIAVEPATAACLDRVAAAGAPAAVATPGTSMAGLDCAEVSAGRLAVAARRDARHDRVSDDEAHAAMRELAALGLAIGDCGRRAAGRAARAGGRAGVRRAARRGRHRTEHPRAC